MKKQDIRLGKSLHSCQARATQPNRRKRVLRAGKVEGDKPVPTVMSSTKHQGTSKNICRRTGVDTDRCLVASSVSVSPNELCLFDLVGHDILVSSMSSDSYHLFPSLTWSFSSSELWYPIKSFILKVLLPLCIMSGCVSLHPLPSAVEGRLSDDNWTRHWSMDTAEYRSPH